MSSFKLDAASYIHKFRTAKRSGSESYKMFNNRLQELQTYYLESKEINSFESLKCDMILEQFISTLTPAIKSFVLARRPMNIAEASDFADLAFQVGREQDQASRSGEKTGISKNRFKDQAISAQNNNKDPSSGMRQADSGLRLIKHHYRVSNVQVRINRLNALNWKIKQVLQRITCFTCGEKGHKSGNSLCKGKVGQS